MPQLMPFYWSLSVFMSSLLLLSYLFLFYKKESDMMMKVDYSLNVFKYNFMW